MNISAHVFSANDRLNNSVEEKNENLLDLLRADLHFHCNTAAENLLK